MRKHQKKKKSFKNTHLCFLFPTLISSLPVVIHCHSVEQSEVFFSLPILLQRNYAKPGIAILPYEFDGKD